jgi:hypothetical protein
MPSSPSSPRSLANSDRRVRRRSPSIPPSIGAAARRAIACATFSILSASDEDVISICGKARA